MRSQVQVLSPRPEVCISIKDNQSITLKTYDLFPERYADTTGYDMSWSGTAWVNEFLSLLPKDSVILEIGSATGRDANYIEKRGHKIIRTDASKGFIQYMRSKGQQAELYNPLKSAYPKHYDAIYAAAVFLHFNSDQLVTVLTNLLKNLPRGGLFLFWTKLGDGEEYSLDKMQSPRYFKYWRPESLSPILEKHGLAILKQGETEGGKWLHYILRKA